MNAQSYLRPCSSGAESCELFVVEGKSAADAVNNVRSRRYQAVYAMQGKMPNPARHPLSKLMDNPHCAGLFSTLGNPGGDAFELAKLPYSKVLILGDADADGQHSQSMLLQLFQRYFEPLIGANRLFRIDAPSYRLTSQGVSNPGGSNPADSNQGNGQYLYSEREKNQLLEDATAAAEPLPLLSQLKGIASMSSDEISKLLLTPETRREFPILPSGPTISDHE